MDATIKESHEAFIARLEAIRVKNSIMYRGYIIEPTSNGCPYGGYDFYPASEGRNDDADYDGESYHYTGNVGFASTIDDAKDQIFEKIMTSTQDHKVVMNGRPYYFPWIDDAIKFAVKWNAEEFIPAISQLSLAIAYQANSNLNGRDANSNLMIMKWADRVSAAINEVKEQNLLQSN